MEAEHGLRKTRIVREVMREVVEYAVGIFHGSIMAIQSEGARVEFVVSARQRARRGAVYPEEKPMRAAMSSRMCSPSIPAGIPVGVFFPFPGNRTEKGA